jgi:RNA polymerase-binding transcription factor DksA
VTTTLHDPAVSAVGPLELLRGMLEEQYAVDTARLTRVTVQAALPQQFGRDPRTLAAQTAAVRERIAATAHALRRMSEGVYGRCEDCEQEIPLGRLRATPQATRCVRCERRLTPAPAAARPAGSEPWRPAPPPAG